MKKGSTCLFFFILLQSVLFAHRVNIFARIEGKQVICQCFYNDGQPVIDQSVTVVLSNDTIIAQGTTDNKGIFSFSPNVQDDLIIKLDAGMGHAATTTISKDELPRIEKPPVNKKPLAVQPSVKKDVKNKQPDHITEQQVREIVEQVIEKKTRSIIDLIQEHQQTQSLTTIIGGIGYIVGIFGLYMFFRSRKKK